MQSKRLVSIAQKYLGYCVELVSAFSTVCDHLGIDTTEKAHYLPPNPSTRDHTAYELRHDLMARLAYMEGATIILAHAHWYSPDPKAESFMLLPNFMDDVLNEAGVNDQKLEDGQDDPLAHLHEAIYEFEQFAQSFPTV